LVQRNIDGDSPKPGKNTQAITRVALLTAVLTSVIVLGFLVHRHPAQAPSAPPAQPAVAQAAAPPEASIARAAKVVPQEAGIGSPVEIIVRRNDTLDGIFRRLSLDLADLSAIRNLPGIRQSLDYLKPGDSIKLTRKDGEVRELSRRVSDKQTLSVVRGESGFTAQLSDDPLETRLRSATAVIDSSLFQAAESADVSDAIALKLATVFAWDIDFVLDIREGDRFTAVYEQIYQDGKYVRDGELLAAEFVNDGKLYRAVRFAQGGNIGYYTPQGQPMRKAFLRAPVDFTRVSSAFNPHRLHPILNTIRGHMGTDYAAPIGTPVHASGEGRVSFEGVRGGYGNAIMLTHGGGVATLYGHLSHFARNVHVGGHVLQGQVIAYVGMTGLATGPHLHYEYLIDGVHKNPETVRLPGAEALRADALQQFRLATAPLLAQLTPSPESPLAPQTPAAASGAGTAVAAASATSAAGASSHGKRSAR
jgi:murein DD-endopeptidase MepM/ murein hydrolase activator NlpD